MRIVKLTLFYLMMMILAMALSLAGVRLSVALGIFVILVGAIFYRLIHILYRTNNMQVVDKLVKQKKKQPFFAYVYANANAYGTKEEKLKVLDEVISKYKQPMIKNNYRFHKAILEQDVKAAKEAAENIQKEPLTSYAFCYIAALEGRTADMRSDKLTQSWMQPAIEAVYAHSIKDNIAFDRFSKDSIDAARGMQKYSLLHSFAQMKQEVEKS